MDVTIEDIKKHFPNLSEIATNQLKALPDLYRDWNSKINVISRKDTDHINEHHILHALSIAKYCTFAPGTDILDLGTGGGFPGIPLAILFPKCHFTLIDGTGKKIKVVKAISEAIGLSNIEAIQVRAEELKQRQFDFVVTRAVARLDMLWMWSSRLIHTRYKNALPNGLIALKGGKMKSEIKALPKGLDVDVLPITALFNRPYYEEKHIVYVQK